MPVRLSSGVIKHRRAVGAVSSSAAMAALWVLFVAGTKLQEMIVGFVSVTISCAFLLHVGRRNPLDLDLRLSDLAQGWRAPWCIVKDAGVILLVLFQDLCGQPAGSFYRVTGFHTGERDPQLVARRVLATVYATASPNSIILGVDPAQSRMLFHQIRRSPVPELLRKLGAQP
jgi:multisubunit Na+/H+ antiporter MnhE subunit